MSFFNTQSEVALKLKLIFISHLFELQNHPELNVTMCAYNKEKPKIFSKVWFENWNNNEKLRISDTFKITLNMNE